MSPFVAAAYLIAAVRSEAIIAIRRNYRVFFRQSIILIAGRGTESKPVITSRAGVKSLEL